MCHETKLFWSLDVWMPFDCMPKSQGCSNACDSWDATSAQWAQLTILELPYWHSVGAIENLELPVGLARQRSRPPLPFLPPEGATTIRVR